MRAPLFLISFALSSAACSGTADDSGQGAASQDESAAAAEGAGDAAVPAEDYAEEEETERYVFEYSWPAAVAAEAGLDVNQMYDIVKGAAGASWMFCDRGRRMIDTPEKVMSALAIFIKDMDIVYSESKRLQCPTPLASAALQQFISGASLGFAKEDDSSVVKVYETLAGVNVSSSSQAQSNGNIAAEIKEGDNVGEYWALSDGTKEEILEVADESRHFLVLSNEYTRVLKVKFQPNDTTWAHRHAEDSLYFFLVDGGLNVINHVKGSDPMCDCMEFGEVRYGTHR